MASALNCSVRGCPYPHHGNGWCHSHYNRLRQNPNADMTRLIGEPVVASCGTAMGWWRHYRNGETPCSPCQRAARPYWRAQKRRTLNIAPKARRVSDERVTIAACAVDVLETYWPDRLTFNVLTGRIRDVHPEWQEESVERVLQRDLRDSDAVEVSKDPFGRLTWQAREPSWAADVG